MIFEDRLSAGKKLADVITGEIAGLVKNPRVIVLALPRGGVPVGFEIAKKLGAKLNIVVAHKLGAPDNEEFAIGAVAEDSSVFLDPYFSRDISQDYIDNEIRRQLSEIRRRIKTYRSGKPLSSLRDKTVVLVDDGIATGHTMQAAILLVQKQKAKKIIVAVPVLPQDTLENLRKKAEIVYLDAPYPFLAIGRFYQNFEQLADAEVVNYLAVAKR